MTDGDRPARQRSRAGRSPYGFLTMDPSALNAFRRRDAGAVREMYREYGHLVYAVAHRALGQHELAEEAAQQTFVRAWRAADRFDLDRDPASWLATIAKHCALDIYRREARRPTRALSEVSVRDEPVSYVPAETLDAIWHVRRAIDALPDEQAVVVRLQHLDGLTQREIAGKLDLPLGTVKSRSRRAHRALAELLGHLREPIDD